MLWFGRALAAVAVISWTSSLFAAEPPASAASVVDFSPRGEIKDVRQVVARFSEAMVPLGDPRQADPFQIDCSEKGSSRWIDTRNWAYDFERDLPAGVRCSFTLRPDVMTLSGKPVDPAAYSFSTGGPAVISTEPWTGSEIDEDQVFVLFVDAEPLAASVLEHVWFAADDIAERIGVRFIEGAEREAIVATLYESQRTQPMVVLQARQLFPSEATVALNWGEGVATQSGVATSQTQTLPFKVRKPFTATFSCLRENAKADCLPVSALRLTFSSAVQRDLAAAVILRAEDGKEWKPEIDRDPSVYAATFEPPFPERASLRIDLPAALRDDAGRALSNASAFPLNVKTAPFPPLAKFAARFGIIEWEAEPLLPVTLRNVEPDLRGAMTRATAERDASWSAVADDLWDRLSGRVRRLDASEPAAIVPWLARVALSRRTESIFADTAPQMGAAVTKTSAAPPQRFTLPKPGESQAMEVVGIPFESPGLYIVELESPRLGASLLGKPEPMYVPAAALVTNMAVHFKWGGESSLVWVTTLDDAEPVAGAEVIIQDCNLNVVWSGSTDADGIARVSGLAGRDDLPRCYGAWTEAQRDDYNWLDYDYEQSEALRSMASGLFVIARTPDDLSFVHSSWKQGIEGWRFRLPSASYESALAAHTVFDRPLFRAGETVQMKHFVRLKTLEGLAAVPESQRPLTVKIQHVGSGDKYELPIAWDAGGMAHGSWQIPERAKLGAYQVIMERGESWRDRRVTGTFRVEEFRVPLMRATVGLPAQPQVGVSSIPVDLQAHYLAGGAAARLPVLVRAQVRERPFAAPIELERFTFSNGSVQPGVTTSSEEEPVAAKPGVHQRQEIELDAGGTARTTITELPAVNKPSDVLVEMEFRDPNGERQTVSSTVPLWPAARLVGIDVEDWTSVSDRLRAGVAVVDVEGKPVAGAPVRVEAFKRSTYSHRERLAGGFYAYKHVTETGPSLGAICSGTTDGNGLYFCEAQPPETGSVVLVAEVEDGGGHKSAAHEEAWVAGDEQWWFNVSHSDRINVIPEKPRYEPGETARFQVRMPFEEATALVTVEREGVAEAKVVELSGKNPVFELPLRASHAPNVFVSVLVVRGRIGGVQPTAMLDLGRPAYKLGVAEVRVGWQGHALNVAVEAAAPVYRVREKASARVRVRLPDGGPPPAGSEIAFAAVDEGLLELQSNGSWKLLDAMMGRRGYDVETATAQTQVIGKRHYGLKALPQGGGGGAQSTRELFDTLLLWKGSVALDAAGDAVVEILLNDSLTSFRLVAIASGGTDRFGTGSTTIRTTQDLMVLPSIPPLAREGDQFRAAVTVRNTTDAVQQVEVSGEASGVGTLKPQSISLAAGTSAEVGWDITIPLGLEAIDYVISATGAAGAADRVRRRQNVQPAVPVRTFQATLAQCDDVLREPVQRPDDALPGRGGVRVALASTLLAGLDGVEDWIADYPYTCFEQKLARAVILRDPPLWQGLADALPTYLDGNGLLKFFPSCESGDTALTAHALALTHAAGLEIPADARTPMLEALDRFATGQLIERGIGTADLPLRKLAAVEALARYEAAKASMLDSITVEPNLWPTSAVINWWSVLLRLATVPLRETRLGEAEQILRARLDLAGTSSGFSAQGIDAFGWLLVTPDTNPLRLILAALDADVWREDLPRIMKGALGRQRRGAWDSTVSNAWGSVAMRKFATHFEAEKVAGVTTGELGGVEGRVDWSTTPEAAELEFPWPVGRADVSIKHEGSGAPWAVIQARAAIPLKQPLEAGYRIEKSIVATEAKQVGELHAGDILRVRLDVDAQRDMTWVVFDDPVPAGASHLGTGLARDSTMLKEGIDQAPWEGPTFVERTFAAVRAYYDYLPKGRHTFEYTIRLNQGGTFQLPVTRIEALYSPEMFGEIPNQPMRVLP